MEDLILIGLQPTRPNFEKHFGFCSQFNRIAGELIESGEIILPQLMEEERNKHIIASINLIEQRNEAEKALWELRKRVLDYLKGEIKEITQSDYIPDGFIDYVELPEDAGSPEILFLWFTSWNSVKMQLYWDQAKQEASDYYKRLRQARRGTECNSATSCPCPESQQQIPSSLQG